MKLHNKPITMKVRLKGEYYKMKNNEFFTLPQFRIPHSEFRIANYLHFLAVTDHFFYVFLCLESRKHHKMSAFFTFKLEIHSRACDKEIFISARMGFFHHKHISYLYIHYGTSRIKLTSVYSYKLYHIRHININDKKQKISI